MASFNASLFKNERKQTEKQPDFTGPASISREDFMAIADEITGGTAQLNDNGEIKLRVAGWRKQSKNGRDYISLSLSLDDYVPGNKPAEPASSTGEADFF